MLGATVNQPNAEGSALAVRGPYLNTAKGSQPSINGFQKKNNCPWCEHCRRTGHTKETRWKFHGRLADWKPTPRPSQDSKGNVATTENQIPIEPSPFNKEQMEALQKMLKATVQNDLNLAGTTTTTMAQ